MSPSDEIWVVAGEPSGDTHTAHLVRALRTRRPDLRLRGYGGPRMAAEGVEILHDLASEGIMGIFPVIAALPRIKRLFDAAVRELRERRPAALLLTDYPGFNLRLAAKAKALGIPVIYYVSPQVWAWARWRIRKIRDSVDRMLVILPFEEAVYAESGVDAVFVGHPLMDHLRTLTPDRERIAALKARGRPVVGIFPGSRRHVVKSLAGDLLRAAKILATRPGFADASFAVALAQERFRPLIEAVRPEGLELEILTGGHYEIIEASDLALSTSGTTTLEIAASGTPFVLAYKVSPIVFGLGRLLISVPHIGLVNLVAEREVVPEHVGWRDLSRGLADDAARLWNEPAHRQRQIAGLREVRERLDTEGSYARAAEALIEVLDRATG